MDHQGAKPGKTKKPRNGAVGVRKVKTGCLTCKIRRKKCDEIKPACSQCLNTDRMCDFLSLAPSNPTARKPESSTCHLLDPVLWARREPCSVIPLHDLDALHFEYFQEVCTKEFSLYFETGLWRTILLQAAWTEPCIWHAALAIGALSRGHYVPAESLSQVEAVIEYSVKQYNMAIQTLNNRLDHSSYSWELAILGSVLFITIEVLQGQERNIRMHLEGGLAMLRGLTNVPKCALSDHALGCEVSCESFRAASRSGSNLGYLASALSQLTLQISSFSTLHNQHRF